MINKTLFISSIIITVIVSLLLASCADISQPIEEPSVKTPPISSTANKDTLITTVDIRDIPDRGFFMGVLPMPGEGQSLDDVYAQISSYAEFVPVWGKPTPFYNLAQDISGSWGNTFVGQYIRDNGMFPLIHMSFIGISMTLNIPPGMQGATLSDPKWRQAYKNAALDIVRASRPLYLSLGNEVNRWYEKYGMNKDNPNGFQHYISLYEEVYDNVKKLSPETNVFCVFSREIQMEYREADLSILQAFNQETIDILVFTSYPHSVQGINKPSDIPDDYYSRIMKLMPDKLLGFTELAWPSMDAFGGEQSQSDFLAQAAGRLTQEQGIRLHLLGWPWLHDLNNNDYIGLIKRDGSAKLAYETWKKLASKK